jgi:hydrogenase maturation protease
MTRSVLVACVGNVLLGDDGFGVAVARRLEAPGALPDGVRLIETGTGGLGIVYELMEGYDVLIVVDALEAGREPGTVIVVEPSVPAPADISVEDRQEMFSNLHLAEPSRVFVLARAMGVLPEHVFLVGCQPAVVDDLAEALSSPVARAVQVAAERVSRLAEVALGPDAEAALRP